MPSRVSALLEGDVGDPLVVTPALFTVTGHLHQAVAFPSICVRVLWEGGEGDLERGFSASPRGRRKPPSPRAPVEKTGRLRIAGWVTSPGRAAHGTCQAWLSAELVQGRPAQPC